MILSHTIHQALITHPITAFPPPLFTTPSRLEPCAKMGRSRDLKELAIALLRKISSDTEREEVTTLKVLDAL